VAAVAARSEDLDPTASIGSHQVRWWRSGRRAALFLSRYPDDPHTEKVKWLAEHLKSDQR
jgi:hypothetical protein